MKRTPELKKILSDELFEKTKYEKNIMDIESEEEVKKRIIGERDKDEPRFYNTDVGEKDYNQFLKNKHEHIWKTNELVNAAVMEYRELLRTSEKLFDRAFDLANNLEFLSDEDFELVFREINQLLDHFKELQKGNRRESFTLNFVDISSIKSFDQYIKGPWPMQFVPHKEEIGRILSLAKQAYSSRVDRDESAMSDPIKIIDIGGSNGALGKLVVDLARVNEIEITYITVDPDSATINAAREFYKEDDSLEFISQTAEEYAISQYEDAKDIKTLIELRKRLIDEGEQKINELKIYLVKITENYYIFNKKELEEQYEVIKNHCRVLLEDFDIDLDPDAFENFMDFEEHFEDEYIFDKYGELSQQISYIQKYRETKLQPKIDALTAQIKKKLAKKTANADLVINSWMPPRIDLTSDIQFINGAAILYILEEHGATGCQTNVAYSEVPQRLGYRESYRPGDNYRNSFVWRSHSTPQLRRMSDRRDKKIPFSERMIETDQNIIGEELVSPYSNIFLIQTKPHISLDDLDPRQTGIDIEEIYPWEQELNNRGGAVQQIYSIVKKNSVPNRYEEIPEPE